MTDPTPALDAEKEPKMFNADRSYVHRECGCIIGPEPKFCLKHWPDSEAPASALRTPAEIAAPDARPDPLTTWTPERVADERRRHAKCLLFDDCVVQLAACDLADALRAARDERGSLLAERDLALAELEFARAEVERLKAERDQLAFGLVCAQSVVAGQADAIEEFYEQSAALTRLRELRIAEVVEDYGPSLRWYVHIAGEVVGWYDNKLQADAKCVLINAAYRRLVGGE